MKLQTLALALLLSFLTPAHGQSSNESGGVQPFVNANLGFGMIYGGYGLNLDAGIGHFSGFGSFGYATRSADATVVIKPSFNYQAGIRYYVKTKSDQIFPRIGLGLGWITNYYDTRIGTTPYKQSVYGLSLHTGLQVYSYEGIVFNFDIAMSAASVIFNAQSHPYFFPFYIRPCIGIGYDFSRLYNSNHPRTLKNKEINPMD